MVYHTESFGFGLGFGGGLGIGLVMADSVEPVAYAGRESISTKSIQAAGVAGGA